MKNEQLKLLKERVAALPIVKQQVDNTNIHLQYATREVEKHLKEMESEERDVAILKEEGFITTLWKFLNKYEGKLEKEEKEYLQAKLSYEKAVYALECAQKEKIDLEERLAGLEEDKRSYEAEMEQREAHIKNSMSGEHVLSYKRLEVAINETMRELVETKEAITATERVTNKLKNIEKHLSSAENWATFDIWGGGGMFTDMAKYEHIDNAKQDFRQLSSLVWQLQKELKDIQIELPMEEIGIGEGTRAVDFWFDNIFTDMSVKSKINKDLEQVYQYRNKVRNLEDSLMKKRRDLENEIEQIEKEQEQLIMNLPS